MRQIELNRCYLQRAGANGRRFTLPGPSIKVMVTAAVLLLAVGTAKAVGETEPVSFGDRDEKISSERGERRKGSSERLFLSFFLSFFLFPTPRHSHRPIPFCTFSCIPVRKPSEWSFDIRATRKCR